jgi:hypothetical protein
VRGAGCLALLLLVGQSAAPPAALAVELPAAAASTALPVAVRQAQQAVDREQAGNHRLRQRVDALQARQIRTRAQLRQRDQAIAALRQQLDQLAPAAAGSAGD